MSDGMKRIVSMPKLLFKKSERHESKNDESSGSSITLSLSESLSSFSNHSHKSTSSNKNTENQEAECLKRLQDFYGGESSTSIPDEAIYRFASFYGFAYDDAFAALQGYHTNRRLHLRMDDVFEQFETKRVFTLPGLKTKGNSGVIYMRPARHEPSKMKTADLIDTLCYLLNGMSETKRECRNGVALIANMNDWGMKNYSSDYCRRFLQALQGKEVPTKVELFLIVNPPAWFGQVWKGMKPVLSKSFSRKVHMIKEKQLGEFLMEGYEQYLPEEFANGWKDIDEMIEDLADLKHYEDDLKEL